MAPSARHLGYALASKRSGDGGPRTAESLKLQTCPAGDRARRPDPRRRSYPTQSPCRRRRRRQASDRRAHVRNQTSLFLWLRARALHPMRRDYSRNPRAWSSLRRTR